MTLPISLNIGHQTIIINKHEVPTNLVDNLYYFDSRRQLKNHECQNLKIYLHFQNFKNIDFCKINYSWIKNKITFNIKLLILEFFQLLIIFLP